MGAVALTAEGLEPTQTRLLNGRFARLRDTLAFEDAGALTEIITEPLEARAGGAGGAGRR